VLTKVQGNGLPPTFVSEKMTELGLNGPRPDRWRRAIARTDFQIVR